MASENLTLDDKRRGLLAAVHRGYGGNVMYAVISSMPEGIPRFRDVPFHTIEDYVIRLGEKSLGKAFKIYEDHIQQEEDAKRVVPDTIRNSYELLKEVLPLFLRCDDESYGASHRNNGFKQGRSSITPSNGQPLDNESRIKGNGSGYDPHSSHVETPKRPVLSDSSIWRDRERIRDSLKRFDFSKFGKK